MHGFCLLIRDDKGLSRGYELSYLFGLCQCNDSCIHFFSIRLSFFVPEGLRHHVLVVFLIYLSDVALSGGSLHIWPIVQSLPLRQDVVLHGLSYFPQPRRLVFLIVCLEN